MDTNIIGRANEIVNSTAEACIGVIDEGGFPSVSTVSSVKTDGIYKVFFATGIEANKTKRILNNGKTSVCFQTGGDNVTLVGEARIVTDRAVKHELWQDWFIAHFPEGADDPTYCVIEFTAQRASLWVEGKSAEFLISDLLTVQSRCGLLCRTCSFREPCNCGGCIETMGNPFHGKCPVATCCQNKGFQHCGECPDIPCEQLKEYSCSDSEHADKPKGARIALCRKWAGKA